VLRAGGFGVCVIAVSRASFRSIRVDLIDEGESDEKRSGFVDYRLRPAMMRVATNTHKEQELDG
jgi:hypothetical protein